MTGRRNNSRTALHMQQTLMLGPQTVEQLAGITGLSVTAVRRWINSMREMRAVYIATWAPDSRGRLFTPAYRWGKKDDAKRPGPQRTSTDRMRDYRARKAANAHS